VLHRRLSTQSRTSVNARLLSQSDIFNGHAGRSSQKVYIVNEDLTMVIAGFHTSVPGQVAFLLLGAMTLGLAFLLFRWLPRSYVRLVGRPAPLSNCDWVVIEVRMLLFISAIANFSLQRINGGSFRLQKSGKLSMGGLSRLFSDIPKKEMGTS
jgi:hypothetical protein